MANRRIQRAGNSAARTVPKPSVETRGAVSLDVVSLGGATHEVVARISRAHAAARPRSAHRFREAFPCAIRRAIANSRS